MTLSQSRCSAPIWKHRFKRVDGMAPLGLFGAQTLFWLPNMPPHERGIEADGGDAFDGDEIFSAAKIVGVLAVIASVSILR